MKILLLGKIGQLGWELERCLAPLGDVTALDYPDIDMANPDLMRRTVRKAAPELIINATAFTAVDKAESVPDVAHAINAKGPGILAEEARALGAALIHYSTDYVFDGTTDRPYRETDAPHPLSVYGKSKLGGEQAVQAVGGAYLILRTAWVYSLRGDSFVNKVLLWSRQHETLRIVEDQVSNPTWARALAETTAQVLTRGIHDIQEHAGLYHLAGSGYTSRLDWAREILKLDPARNQQSVKWLVPGLTEDFPAPAKRPLFSALDCSRFEGVFGVRLPPWETALQMAMSGN